MLAISLPCAHIILRRINLAGADTVVDTDVLPGSGPAVLIIPDLGNLKLVLDITDPEMDDYGLGTYTYPSDTVFQAGCFDIVIFQVGIDAENIVFKFTMNGPVKNPWSSPNGLSIQTYDLYIDTDGDGQGGD